MTNKNDERNWFVLAINGDNMPVIIGYDQAENKAKAIAEGYAVAHPGQMVCVYKREATVTGAISTKWE